MGQLWTQGTLKFDEAQRPPGAGQKGNMSNIHGKLIIAGEIDIRGEQVIGLVVKCTQKELAAVENMPIYREVTVIETAEIARLQERDELQQDCFKDACKLADANIKITDLHRLCAAKDKARWRAEERLNWLIKNISIKEIVRIFPLFKTENKTIVERIDEQLSRPARKGQIDLQNIAKNILGLNKGQTCLGQTDESR